MESHEFWIILVGFRQNFACMFFFPVLWVERKDQNNANPDLKRTWNRYNLNKTKQNMWLLDSELPRWYKKDQSCRVLVLLQDVIA